MKDAIVGTFRLHLLNRQTDILEPYSIYIDRSAIGIQDDDDMRDSIGNAAKFVLILPNLLFRLFALSDIHIGPDKFYEVAQLVQDGMPDGMEVLDGSIRKNNGVVLGIVLLRDFGPFEEFQYALLVLGMISAKPEFRRRRILIRFDPVYSKYLR